MSLRMVSFAVGLVLMMSNARAGDVCEVLYVAKGHTNPTNDGSSWANAFCNNTALADALAAAVSRLADADPPPCIDIWVAGGVYKPSDSGASFALHDKVNLYGGFKVGDDFSMRRTGCIGGDNPGRPCETNDDCPGGSCDTDRVTIISGDINDDDGAPCNLDADCGGTNLCIGGQCLIGPNFGPLIIYDRAGDQILDGFAMEFGNAVAGSAIRILGQAGQCPLQGPMVRSCLVRNNYTPQVSASNGGGAMRSTDAKATIENCAFQGNEAAAQAGAFRSQNGELRITNSMFTANRARSPAIAYGGALYLTRTVPNCEDAAAPTIEHCQFVGNSAGVGWGGAIATWGDTLVVRTSRFVQNDAAYAGAVSSGALVIEGCDFDGNVGNLGVGAIIAGGVVRITGSTFSENRGSEVGALEAEADSLVIDKCKFLNNVGVISGAVLILSSWGARVADVLFAGNAKDTSNSTTLSATALAVDGVGDMICERCYFVGNGEAQGTVTVTYTIGEATFADSVFAGNRAPALSLNHGPAATRLTNCTIASNASPGALGALSTIYLLNDYQSSVDVQNSILWNNSDTDSLLECTDAVECGQSCSCATCDENSPCFTCNPYVTVSVSHSNIQHPSCVWPGEGNINQDPQFVRNHMPRDCDGNGWGDPQCAAGPCLPGVTGCDDYGDFRLKPTSPCLNSGYNAAPDLPDTDLDGNPRIAGCPEVVDMGAYEAPGGGECCLDADCAQGLTCCENTCTPFADADLDTVPDCRDLCPNEDDTIDVDENGVPDCAQFFPIPTVSTWGMVTLALLLLIAAKLSAKRQVLGVTADS